MDLTDKTWEEVISYIIKALLEKGMVGWFILTATLSFSFGCLIVWLFYRKATKNLEKTLTATEKSLNESQATLSEAKQDLLSAKQDLTNTRNTLFQTQQELATCKNNLSSANQSLAAHQKHLPIVEQELDDYKKKLSEIEKKLGDREKEIATFKQLESYLYIDSACKNDLEDASDPALDPFIKSKEPLHT